MSPIVTRDNEVMESSPYDQSAAGPTPQPVSGRRSLVPIFVIAGAILGLLVAGFVVYRLVLPSLESPEEVAQNFAQAIAEDDVLTVCELAADEIRSDAFSSAGVDNCADLAEATDVEDVESPVDRQGGPVTVEITDAREFGEEHLVFVSLHQDGSVAATGSVNLQEQEGRWKVTTYSLD